MLFHSTLRKELARSFGASLVVLVTIVMTMTLIRTLSLASRGSVNPEEVMMVMGYTVLGYLPTILTLSLFISIVGTLSRMYRDSEMVIWFSAGRGLAALVRPLFAFAWPVLAVVTLLAMVAWPWANQQAQDLKDRYGRRGDLERVAPGQFQESQGGRRVFFLDKDTPDNKSGKNIFISSLDKDKETVTSARSGRIEFIGDDQFLLLSNGQQLENSLKGDGLRISEFELHGTRMRENSLLPGDKSPARTRSSLDLLAVTVSSVNPRVGRSGNLVFALFAFVVYFNLLNMGQGWIAAGRTPFLGFVAVLHGGTFGLALLWLAKQHNNWGLQPLLRRLRGAAA
jgi:lipopolysaccharide export system permease protein